MATWTPKGHVYSQGKDGLHEEIMHFSASMSPTTEQEATRKGVVARIDLVLKATWPESKVELFGSSRTGLYLPNSDIDIVAFGTSEDLDLVARKLEEAGISNPEDVKVIASARVPIIKLKDNDTGINIDISFNIGEGIETSEFVRRQIEKFPCLKQLLLPLKQLLQEHDLNNSRYGGMSSYCLTLLLISFLQITKSQEMVRSGEKLGVLLLKFLEKYGCHFDYRRKGLRIRDGGACLLKSELRKTMDCHSQRGELVVEDPVYPRLNVGRHVYKLDRIQSLFFDTHTTLQKRVRCCSSGEGFLQHVISPHQHVDYESEYPAQNSNYCSSLSDLSDCEISTTAGAKLPSSAQESSTSSIGSSGYESDAAMFYNPHAVSSRPVTYAPSTTGAYYPYLSPYAPCNTLYPAANPSFNDSYFHYTDNSSFHAENTSAYTSAYYADSALFTPSYSSADAAYSATTQEQYCTPSAAYSAPCATYSASNAAYYAPDAEYAAPSAEYATQNVQCASQQMHGSQDIYSESDFQSMMNIWHRFNM